MKNIIFLTVILLSLLFSCKKSATPSPTTTTTNNTTNNTNASFSVSATSIVKDSSVSITATATTSNISKVEVLDSAGNVLSTMTSSPYTYTTGALTVGKHTYTVEAYETGNATPSSTSVSFTITTTGKVVLTAQQQTELILANYINTSLTFEGGNGQYNGTLTITPTTASSGTLTSSALQPVGEFYVGADNSGTYTINSSGYLIVTDGTYNTTYTVSTTVISGQTQIVLQKDNNGTQIYKFL